MPQMNTITKHASKIMISRTLNVLSTVKQTKAQREVGTHWSTNQTPHLPHLKFKLDPLVIPSGVAILWTLHFRTMGSCPMTQLDLYLFMKIWFLEKGLESPLIFVLFLKRKKIRKKTLSVIPYLEKTICEKPKLGSEIKLLIGKVR